MKYQIIGKNVKGTDGISSAIEKKLSKMDKYFLINENVECRAVISVHGETQRLEITIFLAQMPMRVEVEHEDLYAAIDLAVDKLEGQMRKIKTKMDRSNGKVSFARSINFDEVEEDDSPKENDVIVRAKSYYLTPMSIEEAAIRMEALGHDFFVYLDEEDDRISVLYNRRDGGYGVIQAENEIRW